MEGSGQVEEDGLGDFDGLEGEVLERLGGVGKREAKGADSLGHYIQGSLGGWKEEGLDSPYPLVDARQCRVS